MVIYLTFSVISKSSQVRRLLRPLRRCRKAGVTACLAGQAGMLNLFWYAGKNNKKIKYFKVWQDGNDAQEIHTTAFLEEKMNYIHHNPVKSELVANPEDYLYSSARDYAGEKGLVEILFA